MLIDIIQIMGAVVIFALGVAGCVVTLTKTVENDVDPLVGLGLYLLVCFAAALALCGYCYLMSTL